MNSALSAAAALVLFLWFSDEGWVYVRGHLDRLSSAVFTAIVVMVVNLVFEYRAWKDATTVIERGLAG